MDKPERLQKVLAHAGVASRRHAEGMITAGRVRVNGRVVTELGTRVDPRRDKVEVDGQRVLAEPVLHYLFHKPRGMMTTLQDPEGRPCLGDHLKAFPVRVYPVGRLDYHTSGALLLTNDGDLAMALMHPRHGVPKVYVCKVRGTPTEQQLQSLREGVYLEPTDSDPRERRARTAPAEVELLRQSPPGENALSTEGTSWLKVTLREGRTRQLHRMAEAVGLFVMRLARLSFAGLDTEALLPGEHRELTDKEVTALRVQYLRPLENAAPRPLVRAPQEPTARPSPPRTSRTGTPRAERSPARAALRAAGGERGADARGSRKASAARPRGPRR
jgi:23S rRNA pseudouridine2605 synthase